ncbi:MAG TPA: hypothetical protein DDW65_19975 [Firmicutes bacterium]|jgi:hypothetical protein|nr:hypothetical protein [Bacillota bacterium]
MKKFYSLLVVGVLLLAVSGMAFATVPDASGNISGITGTGITAPYIITAVVDPYAEITWGDLLTPILSGAALDYQVGSLGFNVVANCAVDITLATPQLKTDLTMEDGHAATDTDTIATTYAVKPGKPNVNVPQSSEYSSNSTNKYVNALDQEAKDFTLYYKVSDGSVISQHAGLYTADINLTVVAQAY